MYLFLAVTTLLAASYLLYPVGVILIASVARHARQKVQAPSNEKRVSVIVCAFNEEACIEGRLRNLLADSDDQGLFEIIVASDGSTDNTNEILVALSRDNQKLKPIICRSRRGKNACLNDAVAAAQGELLLFTDANSMFSSGAVQRLTAHFARPNVGCVGGEEIHLGGNEGTGADAKYMSFEARLKRAESILALFFSCNGSIMMVRRKAFRVLALDVPNDMQTPLDVWSQGYEVLYEPEATSLEFGVQTASENLTRKRRIVGRAAVCAFRNIARVPWRIKASLMLHKMIRWATLPLMVIATLAAFGAGAAGHSLMYGVAILLTAAISMLLLCAYAESSIERSRISLVARALQFPAYVGIVLLAASMALVDLARGRRFVTWTQASSTRTRT